LPHKTQFVIAGEQSPPQHMPPPRQAVLPVMVLPLIVGEEE